ncbi:hypothetical protein BDQ17DRAFT_1429346 [Cyathus striatus]|nr:hypothetical protein BDQ17DRAFT_1429346 [Cyathus striatus]
MFDRYWKTEVGVSWSECINSKIPTDIIIDNVQMLSTSANFFWNYIRDFLRSPTRHPYLRFLMIGCYFDVDSILGIDSGNEIPLTSPLPSRLLNLSEDEYEKLVDMVNMKNGCTIPGPIERLVFNYTLGHVGLARMLLDTYASESHLNSQIKEVLRVTTSSTLMAQVRSCIRPVTKFTLAERYMLIDMLYASDETSSTTYEGFLVKRARDPEVRKTIVGLRTYGIIIEGKSPDHVQFVAPVFKILFGQQIFRRLTDLRIQLLPRWYDFEELMPEREDSDDGVLYAFATAVSEFGLVTPFIGPTVGANGLFLDMHVSRLEWGIDILREGDPLPEYAHVSFKAMS